MADPAREARPLRALEWALSGIAGLAGLRLGYGFGVDLAGMWLGLIMGFNAGLFAALLASIATDRAFRRWARGSRQPKQPKDI